MAVPSRLVLVNKKNHSLDAAEEQPCHQFTTVQEKIYTCYLTGQQHNSPAHTVTSGAICSSPSMYTYTINKHTQSVPCLHYTVCLTEEL